MNYNISFVIVRVKNHEVELLDQKKVINKNEAEQVQGHFTKNNKNKLIFINQ